MPLENRGRPGTVVIVGGGCSGALVAANLLEHSASPIDVVVVEPSGQVGAGVAYSTDDDWHLLNQPAGAMSAASSRPDDFTEWARANGVTASPCDFLPRRVYRGYLEEVLCRASRAARGVSGFAVVAQSVTAVAVNERPGRPPITVGLADGGHVTADHLVLAVGGPARRPELPGLEEELDRSRFVEDPWSRGALQALSADDDVLLIGTGLTMIDVALTLAHSSSTGRVIHARSRHGLVPLEHCPGDLAPWPGLVDDRYFTGSVVMASLRTAFAKAATDGWDWRSVVAAVRPHVAERWSALSAREQRRLARHALRHWEVHRHRMAPQVAAAFAALREEGKVTVGRGRIADMYRSGDRLRIELSRRGATETLHVSAVVNCTGPSADLVRSSPLVRQMASAGLARRHPNGMGLDVDDHGDLVGRTGVADPRLHTVGFARRGSLLESTAVPEIREQAERLARRLLAQAA